MKYWRWIRAVLVLSALVPAAAMASACGGGSSQGSYATTPANTPASVATAPAAAMDRATVRAVEGLGDPRTAWGFDPPQLTVHAGGAISFTNTGKEAHTATADDGSFDTGPLSAGDVKPIKFDHAGTFGYHCSLHPWMKGEVIVTPPGTTSYNNGSSY